MNSTTAPIGVFDSGVGGLSILRQILLQSPAESTLYFADQAHVPYGSRSLAEVRGLALEISRALLEQGCKMIVVACNTASAAALHELRGHFAQVPFVGMEPAVKPAAELSQSRKVAVLATPTTFRGELFASVVERFGADLEVVELVLPGLVEQIETGMANSEESHRILSSHLKDLQDQGVDTLVLGCTHYAFTIPLLEQIMGPSVQVIDPAPAIARQVARLLRERDLAAEGTVESHRYLTSGDPAALQAAGIRLLGTELTVEPAGWAGNRLTI